MINYSNVNVVSVLVMWKEMHK